MNDIIQTSRSKLYLFFIVIELIVLLILPLPFLHLNIFYVVAALVLTISIKYLRKERWADLGFFSVHIKKILIAVAIGLLFGLTDNYLFDPLLSKLLGKAPDLSAFAGIKGNVQGLLVMLAIGWFIGGVFEEYFFRGYLFHRFSTLIRNRRLYQIITISLISIVFALGHSYQGVTGMIETFYFSIIMGLLYFYFGKNVWYLMLVHGMYDTVGIIWLFLGL